MAQSRAAQPPLIRHLGDTALWVAHLRAEESARADALLYDPLARELAGERGARIARCMPQRAATAWGVVMRTVAIDGLLGEALSEGVDTVVNLGAGLDTRPYRLPLPAGLRWLEIDIPDLLEAKNAALAAHTPRCAVQRLALDLREPDIGGALRAALPGAGRRVLVLSEGLIPYLTAAQAARLAQTLHELPGAEYWIQDYENAGARPPMPRGWSGKLAAAPLVFQVPNWFEFFRASGWQAQRVVSSGAQSVASGRRFPPSFPRGWLLYMLPTAVRRAVLDATGATLLRRWAADT